MRAIRTGCKLLIKKPYYVGRWQKPIFEGSCEMWVEVLRHSYGKDKGQHTFTCKVLSIEECSSDQAHKVGESFRIKGRNLYPIVKEHIQGEESKNVDDQWLEKALKGG